MCNRIGPGPKYNLPTLTGYENHDTTKYRNPQYSFAKRIPTKNTSISPGPKYNLAVGEGHCGLLLNVGVCCAPAYTLGKRFDGLKVFKTPAPGAHDVKFNSCETAAPNYSMGRKLDPLKRPTVPAPNAYGVDGFDSIYAKQPEYSIGLKLPAREVTKTPGPAAYPCCGGGINYDLMRAKGPIYTMGLRIAPLKKFPTPAPNKYAIDYLPGKKPPQYSFGVKHSDCAPPMIVPCDN